MEEAVEPTLACRQVMNTAPPPFNDLSPNIQ